MGSIKFNSQVIIKVPKIKNRVIQTNETLKGSYEMKQQNSLLRLIKEIQTIPSLCILDVIAPKSSEPAEPGRANHALAYPKLMLLPKMVSNLVGPLVSTSTPSETFVASNNRAEVKSNV